MEELISVIVPVYNVEKYLKKCIDSITSQTYKKLEIILVDDGSTDNSGNICDEYKNKDSRIKVIHKNNGGLSSARNAGMIKATGKYVAFVDSDDYIEKDMYEVLYNNLINTNSDISICNFFKIKENQKIQIENIPNEVITYERKEGIKKLIEEEMQSYAWNKLYKKKLFKDILYPEGKKMEDLAIMYLIFEKANKIVYTSQKKYYYVQNSNSILGNIKIDLILDLKQFVNERYKYIKDNYKELQDIANVNKLKNIHIYFRNLCEIREYKKCYEKEFNIEYIFYKNQFSRYKKELLKRDTTIMKVERYLLYINKELFIFYFKIKNILKKILKRQID